MRFKRNNELFRFVKMVSETTKKDIGRGLCAHLVKTGIIEDPNAHWGESVLIATGPRYVKDVCAALAAYLYDDETRSIPADVFDAFCALTIVGDGGCPNCGGELEFVETDGHELNDGDYYTPNSYVIDNYVYRCVECGEIIKTPNEL